MPPKIYYSGKKCFDFYSSGKRKISLFSSVNTIVLFFRFVYMQTPTSKEVCMHLEFLCSLVAYFHQLLFNLPCNIILDLSKKSGAGGQKAKPKALKAQSVRGKSAVVRAFKPKIQPKGKNDVNRHPSNVNPVRTTANKNKSAVNRNPVKATKPVGHSGGKNGGIKSKLETALQTASAVMNNKQHKNYAEVQQLVDSYKKKWVTEKKFLELLPRLVFA